MTEPLQSISRGISSFLDLPIQASTSTLPATYNSVPTSTSHTSPSTSSLSTPLRPYYGTHVSSATIRTSLPSATGDDLPAYTREVPTTAVMPSIPKQLHTFTSKTLKLKVDITAMGEGNRIVLIQDPSSEGKVWIEGGELKS